MSNSGFSVSAAFAASAIVGLSGASAADHSLYTKAPAVVAAPAYNWNGWYIGASAGAAFGERANMSATPTFGAATFMNEAAVSSALANNNGNGNSFISGIHAGYNWQVAPKYVLGVEADIQEISSSRQTVSSEVPAFPTETIFSTINPAPTYLGTVRGRVGFLAAPALLLYGTGGLAYGGRGSITQNDVDSSGGCFITGTWCHPYGTNFGTQFGFAAGAGGEWMIKPNWSVKAEYLYYRLGGGSSSTLTNNFLTNGFGFAAGTPAWSSALQAGRLDGNIVRVGFSYHFSGPSGNLP